MPTIDTVVIGAGQAGLAMSRTLAERGVDHVVLERGRVAERWRTERWDSMRLLTPNWMARLPGWSYSGPEVHGFMSATEVVDYFQGYADATSSPIVGQSAVVHVGLTGSGFDVGTTGDRWQATNVVVATGWCDQPSVPAIARSLDPVIQQVVPSTYRNPDSVPEGGVLVVGASATGVQLADELARAGRAVVLAVGSHSRLPRRYRGMDIYWWLERIGSLDRTIEDLPDPSVARHEPSLQLVGRPDHRNLDLADLQHAGVELVGRLAGLDGAHARFAVDLAGNVAQADARMRRVLAEIDTHIDATGLTAEVFEAEPHSAVAVGDGLDALDLRARGITSVIWATGYRRSYPWLQVPVLDAHGEIRQRRGVTPVPGMYVVGQRFQHYRNSNFIDGVGRDATFVADHLAGCTAPIARPC